MPPPLAIPHRLHDEVLRLADDGLNSEQIADALAEAHGIKASGAVVLKVLARRRQERGEITRGLLRERLGKVVTSDLDALQKRVDEQEAIADRLSETVLDALETLRAEAPDGKISPGQLLLWQPIFSELRKTTEQIRRLVDTRLHYAGGNEPDAPTGLGEFLALAFAGGGAPAPGLRPPAGADEADDDDAGDDDDDEDASEGEG